MEEWAVLMIVASFGSVAVYLVAYRGCLSWYTPKKSIFQKPTDHVEVKAFWRKNGPDRRI